MPFLPAGASVIWLRRDFRRWPQIDRIPATVIRHTGSKVTIEATVDHHVKRVSVDRANLQEGEMPIDTDGRVEVREA